LTFWQTESEVKRMSPRTGRPPIENPKMERITVRLTEYQQKILQKCSEKFGATKADIICRGLALMEVEMEDATARQLLDAMVLFQEFKQEGREDLAKKQAEQIEQNFKWYLKSIKG
jgi:hypothetical protein